MRVFVTGATGFVGTRVCEDLMRVGYEVRALCRAGSEFKWSKTLRKKVNLVEGDVLNEKDLRRGMKGCGAVIHLVGIIREFRKKGATFERMHVDATRAVLAAAQAEGVKRYLHMSALGTRPNAVSRYHTTKWAAEELVRASGLDWTIFRPSLIIGPGKGFAEEMARLIQMGWIPVIGPGDYRMPPVALNDVSRGFVLGVETPEAVGQIYDMGGPDVMTFTQVLDVLGVSHSYERLHKIHVPVKLALALAKRLDQLPFFPFGVDQIKMVSEDNVGPASDATWRRFGIKPMPTLDAISRFLGTPVRLNYDPDVEVARALEEGKKRVAFGGGSVSPS